MSKSQNIKSIYKNHRNEVVVTISIFIIYLTLHISTWLPLRYWKIWGGKSFLDSWQVLNYADCFKRIGLEVYRSDFGYCSGYIYGRYLLKFLNIIHLDVKSTFFIGISFMLFMSITLAFILNEKVFKVKNGNYILGALVILSPPMMLLVERGNFDIIMVVLVIVSALSFSRSHEKLAIILIFLSALIKFYTLPILFSYLLLSKKASTRFLSFFVCIFGAYLIVKDINFINRNGQFPSGVGAMFGLNIWPNYVGSEIPYRLSSSIGMVISLTIFLACILLSFFLVKLRNFRLDLHFESFSAFDFIFISSSIVFVSVFVSGMNFDYRLIWFILSCTLSFRYLIVASHGFILTFVLLIALWLSYPSGGLAPLGDLAVEWYASFLIVNAFQLVCKIFKKHSVKNWCFSSFRLSQK